MKATFLAERPRQRGRHAAFRLPDGGDSHQHDHCTSDRCHCHGGDGFRDLDSQDRGSFTEEVTTGGGRPASRPPNAKRTLHCHETSSIPELIHRSTPLLDLDKSKARKSQGFTRAACPPWPSKRPSAARPDRAPGCGAGPATGPWVRPSRRHPAPAVPA